MEHWSIALLILSGIFLIVFISYVKYNSYKANEVTNIKVNHLRKMNLYIDAEMYVEAYKELVAYSDFGSLRGHEETIFLLQRKIRELKGKNAT